jgi:hypothetical protein
MAYEEAGVESPTDDLAAVYVSDLSPHRELMRLEAMRYDDESFATVAGVVRGCTSRRTRPN